MNLLLFNLATDEQHVTLGFATRMIEKLAAQFDHIDIVTMYEGRHSLPSNVTVWSVGRERGYSRGRRAVRFYLLTWRVLRSRRIDVAFAHMIHVFATMFWPLARLFRVPSVLWYAHGAVPPGLRLAHRSVDRVVTSTPEGFRIASAKVTCIGQGIDIGLFSPSQRIANPLIRLITVGRISKVKNLDLLIDAVQGWRSTDGRPWELLVIGSPASDADRRYEQQLQTRSQGLPDGDRIRFLGLLDSGSIARHLQESDVFLNVSATGSLDKAIVEAMATGCPVISSNQAFGSMARSNHLERWFLPVLSAASIRAALTDLLSVTPEANQSLRDSLRKLAEQHSLDEQVSRLADVLRTVAGDRASKARAA